MSIRDLIKGKLGGAPVVVDEFIQSVWGVRFNNEDGSSRQAIIKTLKPGDDLLFKPAPSKEYPDTIGVFTSKGKQIGFLNSALLKDLRGKYAKNRASVTVENISKSEDQGYSCSMRIKIYES